LRADRRRRLPPLQRLARHLEQDGLAQSLERHRLGAQLAVEMPAADPQRFADALLAPARMRADDLFDPRRETAVLQ
jgi:hypothetical protein